MGTVMKSAIDIIGGPATLLNKISSTAASYIDEVGLVVLNYTLAARYSSALLMLCLA
jgi:hypothetical protein